MKRLALLPAACLAIALGACADRDNPTLAKIDGREIRADDFLNQLRMITAEARPDLSAPEAREEFLLNIVRKELLLAEARARGLEDRRHIMADEDLLFSALQPQIAQHVRGSRPEPPPAEIESLADALAFSFHLRSIYGPDGEALTTEHARLESGVPWTQVEEEWLKNRAARRGGGEIGSRTVEAFPPELRSPIMALEAGRYTPVSEQGGLFYVYYLQEKQPAPPEVTPQWRQQRATETWQREWERKAFDRFLEEARTEASYEVNREFLAQVAQRFHAEAREGIQAGAVVDLWPTFTDAEMKTGVASWEGYTFTLDEFLYRLQGIPDGLRPDLGTVEGLGLALENFTGNKLMARQFDRLGLKLGQEQQWSLQKSSERRLLRRVRRELVEGAEVSEEEIRAFYDARAAEFTGPQEYFARAIVVADSAKAQGIYELLRAGANFAHLAQRHSVHAPSRAKGGELGWIGPHSYEDLYLPLRASRVNANMPPVATPGLGGWTILRLENHRGRRQLEYPEARDMARTTLLEQAEDKKLTEWLDGEIAKRVKMHPERVRALAIPAELQPGAGTAADSAIADTARADTAAAAEKAEGA